MRQNIPPPPIHLDGLKPGDRLIHKASPLGYVITVLEMGVWGLPRVEITFTTPDSSYVAKYAGEVIIGILCGVSDSDSCLAAREKIGFPYNEGDCLLVETDTGEISPCDGDFFTVLPLSPHEPVTLIRQIT